MAFHLRVHLPAASIPPTACKNSSFLLLPGWFSELQGTPARRKPCTCTDARLIRTCRILHISAGSPHQKDELQSLACLTCTLGTHKNCVDDCGCRLSVGLSSVFQSIDGHNGQVLCLWPALQIVQYVILKLVFDHASTQENGDNTEMLPSKSAGNESPMSCIVTKKEFFIYSRGTNVGLNPATRGRRSVFL